MSNLSNRQDEFFDFFDLIIADPAQQIASFKLRHFIYCEELKWEELRANGLETDAFDQQATHILVRHKHSGKYAGTVRLVVANHANKLPHAKFFKGKIDSSFRKEHYDTAATSCETSRLAVSPFFRRRKYSAERTQSFDYFNPNTGFSEAEMRNFSKITIALYMACWALSDKVSTKSLYIAARPWLTNIVQRLGFNFVPVSDCAEMHGKRQLHQTFRGEHITNFSPAMLNLYQNIENTINMQYSWDHYQQVG